ncbi:MAG: hypothetical protein ACOVSW_19240 [Candidatus Kapaibacteriota bacterium]|jgi:hypothetical protein
MKRSLLSLILCALLLAWLSSSCRQPIGPAVEEQDTIKAVLRATITAPGLTNYQWSVIAPDTLSDGKVGFIPYTGPDGVRYGAQAISSLVCSHNLKSTGPSIRIIAKFPFNLTKKPSVNNNGTDHYIDTLRAWEQYELQFGFSVPSTITAPYTPTKLLDVSWEDYSVTEWFAPISQGHSRAQTHWYQRHGIIYISSSRLPEYSAIVEEASLTIDSYDLIKKRASGRFSFRAKSKVNGDVVEIRNGIFENIKLYAFSD